MKKRLVSRNGIRNSKFFFVFVGLNAIKLVTEQGRKVSELCRGSEKQRIMQLCDEIDRLANHLTDLQRRGLVVKNKFHFYYIFPFSNSCGIIFLSLTNENLSSRFK